MQQMQENCCWFKKYCTVGSGSKWVKLHPCDKGRRWSSIPCWAPFPTTSKCLELPRAKCLAGICWDRVPWRSTQAVTWRCWWGCNCVVTTAQWFGAAKLLELKHAGNRAGIYMGPPIWHPTAAGVQRASLLWGDMIIFPFGPNYGVLKFLFPVLRSDTGTDGKSQCGTPSASWIICCNASGMDKQERDCKKRAFLGLFPYFPAYSAMWICPPEIHKTRKQALKHLIWKISV